MQDPRSIPAAIPLLALAVAAALLAACATAPSAHEPEPFAPDFAEPVDLGPDTVVEPPAVLERRFPVYPPRLRAEGVEGRVVARGIVGRDGRLQDVEIVSSDDPLFTQALLAALAEWRFHPATVDGEPVAVFYQLVHDFSLR